MDVAQVGKWLLLAGCFLTILGALLWLAGRMGWPLGRLPGDIAVKGERVSFYFPVVTCIVLSVVITLVLNLIARFFR